jgi:hypothetical protein
MDIPGKSLTVLVIDVPPGGMVPSITTVDPRSISSCRAPSACSSSPTLDYESGGTLFKPPDSVHSYAQNLSETEGARVMLICVAEDSAPMVPCTKNLRITASPGDSRRRSGDL